MSSPVEEIKNRLDIVELIGSYIRLNKAGANFKANCPFHNEKTPSFVVSPARQIWHCFGCSKGGDIFKFVMEIEGYEFPEALRYLADKAGVEVKREDPAIKSERNRLFAIMEEAAKFFESNLAPGSLSDLSNPGAYLRQRGLKDETIKEFRIGYASGDWRTLFNHLTAMGFNPVDIEKAGLIIRADQRNSSRISAANYYDRFRGRIMFPIFDYTGRVVAFGGRVFPDKDDAAKYVNSPETPLYQKSNILYGLNKSKNEILRAGCAIIVEGYVDLIMSWQGGAKNVVASSGTALAPSQLKILSRLCDKILAAFDMDPAGADAARRGIELALKSNFDVRVIRFEGAKDPAEIILKNPSEWGNALKNPQHAVKFFMDLAESASRGDAVRLSREFQQKVLPAVAALSNHLESAYWVGEVSRALRIGEEAVYAALAQFRSNKTSSAQAGETPDEFKTLVSTANTRKALLERRVLGMCAKNPELLKDYSSAIDEKMFSGDSAKAYAAISGITEPSAGIKAFLDNLSLEADMFLETVQNSEEEFGKCALELKREYLKDRLAELTRKIQFAERAGNNSLPALLESFRSVSFELAALK